MKPKRPAKPRPLRAAFCLTRDDLNFLETFTDRQGAVMVVLDIDPKSRRVLTVRADTRNLSSS